MPFIASTPPTRPFVGRVWIGLGCLLMLVVVAVLVWKRSRGEVTLTLLRTEISRSGEVVAGIGLTNSLPFPVVFSGPAMGQVEFARWVHGRNGWERVDPPPRGRTVYSWPLGPGGSRVYEVALGTNRAGWRLSTQVLEGGVTVQIPFLPKIVLPWAGSGRYRELMLPVSVEWVD